MKKKSRKTKKFLKLTIGAELRHQIVTSLKIRRGPANDNLDFKPVCKKAHSVKPLRRGLGDKEDVPVWRTSGKYRKKMKRGYSKKKYHQRSKDETIFSVIKRVMGENVRSVRAKAQNNELRFRMIAYNANRIANLAFFYQKVSTWPLESENLNTQISELDLRNWNFGAFLEKTMTTFLIPLLKRI
jgi:hypothetical protein